MAIFNKMLTCDHVYTFHSIQYMVGVYLDDFVSLFNFLLNLIMAKSTKFITSLFHTFRYFPRHHFIKICLKTNSLFSR